VHLLPPENAPEVLLVKTIRTRAWMIDVLLEREGLDLSFAVEGLVALNISIPYVRNSAH